MPRDGAEVVKPVWAAIARLSRWSRPAFPGVPAVRQQNLTFQASTCGGSKETLCLHTALAPLSADKCEESEVAVLMVIPSDAQRRSWKRTLQ